MYGQLTYTFTQAIHTSSLILITHVDYVHFNLIHTSSLILITRVDYAHRLSNVIETLSGVVSYRPSGFKGGAKRELRQA